MGPWRPSSVPEICRPRGKKKKREKPAFEFVPSGRGAQNAAASALSLAPRLGGRPAFELHLGTRRHLLWSSWAVAGAGPGPVQGRARFSRAAGPLLHHSARRGGSGDGKDCGEVVGFLDLVHRAAAAANVAAAAGGGRRRSLHIGHAWLSAPAITARQFPEVAKRTGEAPAREGRAGEEVRGPAAAGEGGEQARPGRGSGPSSSVAYSEVTRRKRRPLTARPSSPRGTHGRLLRQAPRSPPPTAPTRPRQRLKRALTPTGPAAAQRTQQGPAAGPSPRASPPSPRLHAPL